MQVEIWTDINCPFCYIGKERFELALAKFPHKDKVEVVHRSFELEPNMMKKGETVRLLARMSEKHGITEARALEWELGFRDQATALGLPYLTPDRRDHGSSFDLHRLLHLAKDKGLQNELIDALYRGNFAEEGSVFGDEERVVELAVQAGLVEAEVRVVLADPESYAAEVRADEREGAELGATGVPFVVFDRKYRISGAQPPEVFGKALAQAWESRSPLTAIDGTGSGDACGPERCATP
jgi:predicted DsbA family dithiol-disulfide isomerase